MMSNYRRSGTIPAACGLCIYCNKTASVGVCLIAGWDRSKSDRRRRSVAACSSGETCVMRIRMLETPWQRSCRGFTLTELLVVIGVLAILMALLLPALSRAKGKAHQISCINNNRQMLLAATMYANDHGEELPP